MDSTTPANWPGQPVAAPQQAWPGMPIKSLSETVDPNERRRQMALEGLQHAQDIIAGNAPNPNLDKPGIAARVGRGAEDIARGVGVLAERGISHLPGTDKELWQQQADETVANNQQENQQYEQGRGPNAGIDLARIGGQAAAAAPAMLIPGVGSGVVKAVTAGAAQGAVQGGVVAAGQGEDVTSGAIKGGVAGGTIAGGMYGLSALAGKVGRAIINKFGNTVDPKDIIASVSEVLKSHGIDFKQLSAEAQQSIKDEVSKAISAGGKIDPKAAANKAAFESLGIKPTLGQITQDPTQFGKELFLREADKGAPLAQQYQSAVRGLSDSVQGMRKTLPQALDNPQAGARVMEPLEQGAARGQKVVGTAYDQFKAAAPEGFRINGADFANKFFKEAEKDPGLRNLPSSLKQTLNQLSIGKVKDMSLVDADAINREISRQLGARDLSPAAAFSLHTFKQMLDDHIAETAQGVASDGRELVPASEAAAHTMSQSSEPAQRLFAARKLAEQRFRIMDQIPAMKAVAAGKIEPDDFLQKFVTGPTAKLEDLQNLKDFLQKADPEAFDQIRAQVLSDLHSAASKGSGDRFIQNQFNQKIASLEKSGKLGVLFNPEEVNTLKTIGHVGKLLEGPQGVSRTGLGGAAKLQEGLLDLISKVSPTAGGITRFALRTGANEVASRTAQKAAISTAEGAAPSLSATVAKGLGVGAGAAATNTGQSGGQ